MFTRQVRTWLMNAPQALTKSVLNDYVPKRHRAKVTLAAEPVHRLRDASNPFVHTVLTPAVHTGCPQWLALDSVNSASWSGSALLGGVLADAIGYRHTFLITAALQLCSILLYSPLAALVAAEPREKAKGDAAPGLAALAGGSRADAAMRAPLLCNSSVVGGAAPPAGGTSFHGLPGTTSALALPSGGGSFFAHLGRSWRAVEVSEAGVELASFVEAVRELSVLYAPPCTLLLTPSHVHLLFTPSPHMAGTIGWAPCCSLRGRTCSAYLPPWRRAAEATRRESNSQSSHPRACASRCLPNPRGSGGRQLANWRHFHGTFLIWQARPVCARSRMPSDTI